MLEAGACRPGQSITWCMYIVQYLVNLGQLGSVGVLSGVVGRLQVPPSAITRKARLRITFSVGWRRPRTSLTRPGSDDAGDHLLEQGYCTDYDDSYSRARRIADCDCDWRVWLWRNAGYCPRDVSGLEWKSLRRIDFCWIKGSFQKSSFPLRQKFRLA
jgi:hypothetical protein